MVDSAELTAPILALARGALPAVRQSLTVDPDTDLHLAGMTSMAMVRLMLAVEAAFDISIPDGDLNPENFRSVRALEALVERLRRV
jgi:acyl carrier protein